MPLKIASLCVLLTSATFAQDEWVWKNSARSGKRYDDFFDGSARYEVFENPDHGPASAGSNLPLRPNFVYKPNRPVGLYGGSSVRPSVLQGPRPGGYGQGVYPGVLTGPIPSWQREKSFKYFDTCKCTESFNCNSRGVAYGHCDVGKQYCCHGSKVGPPPSRPIHSIENGILVGPGGPIDRPKYPSGDVYGGSSYGSVSGPSNVLVGPDGPYDRPFPYERSSDKN